jgi:hypothetical protein
MGGPFVIALFHLLQHRFSYKKHTHHFVTAMHSIIVAAMNPVLFGFS